MERFNRFDYWFSDLIEFDDKDNLKKLIRKNFIKIKKI